MLGEVKGLVIKDVIPMKLVPYLIRESESRGWGQEGDNSHGGEITVGQVFVSHTQKDVEFCDIFDRAIARVGIRAFRSEFEKIELPAWKTIRDSIRSSCALFLLVGKELVNAQALHDHSWEHTQNWIAYEIGVACQSEIDVWVICDDTKINFPVPYLNNYLTVSLRNKQSFDYFVTILRSYSAGLKTTFPMDKFASQCPYDDCKAIYNLNVRLKTNEEIVCPQCLQTIVFPKGWPPV